MSEPRNLVDRSPRTLRSVLPIVAWLPRYPWRRDLPIDAVAGVALAALLIPEAMGYAGVAGVPAEVGLYAALGAIVAYALTGRTSILVVGPASAVAALSASIVADFTGDIEPVVLISALAITSGALLMAAGALHLGWIVNFISRPVLEAFVAGLSISIIIGQLDGLFGIEVDGASAVARLYDVITDLGAANGVTVVLGFGALVALAALGRFAERVPAALLVVAVGIAVVSLFDLGSQGVAVVGQVPTGLPDVGLPQLSGTRWVELLGAGMALLLVGFSEGYAAATAIAAQTGEEVDPDQELIGSGAANVAVGLVGGLAVSGSLSKSAASQANGARSQMTNLVGGVVVLATLLFLAPLFENLPEPVLAAVVIIAVLKSANPCRILGLWTVNRADFAAAATTFVLVLVWEPLPAMIVGVALSLAFVVRRASFPDVVELEAEADGGFGARSKGTAGAHPVVGVAILRFEAPLIYANADRLRHAVRNLLAQRPDVVRLVLDAEMVSDLDASGAAVLDALDAQMRDRGIELHLARVHRRARGQIERSHLGTRFDGRLHATLRGAVGE